MHRLRPASRSRRPAAVIVGMHGAACGPNGLVLDRGIALGVGSRGPSGQRGGWVAACRVDVPVNPDRSKPNDALQPTAFGRG
jgi:hypothetical protein